jgi:hypothetical protein
VPAARRFKHCNVQVAMQLIAAARQAAKHGIVRLDEFKKSQEVKAISWLAGVLYLIRILSRKLL